jgi:hypothetical protein
MKPRPVPIAILGAALLAVWVAPVGEASHVTAASGDGRQFVWPVPAWVAANNLYVDGGHHSGSADLSVPHFTPVKAARAGVVIEKRWSHLGGWSLRIEHAGSPYTYTTYYAHLAAEPVVNVGDQVNAVTNGGTTIGYSSRTGHASRGGPHVHFQIIRRDNATGATVTMAIPGLTIGDWVTNEGFVPGNYTGLSSISQPTRSFTVRVTEPGGLRVYSTTDRSTQVATLANGSTTTVSDSYRGQYYVSYTSGSTTKFGWIAHTGTVPVDSNVFGVVTNLNVNIRRTPNGVDVGTIAQNELLTGVAWNSGSTWYKVQWPCSPDTNDSTDPDDNTSDTGGCPGLLDNFSVKYGWVAASVVTQTVQFEAITRIDLLNVYANQLVGGKDDPDSGNQIAELPIATRIIVTEVKNGWYKFLLDGQKAWIRGWYTAGRQ